MTRKQFAEHGRELYTKLKFLVMAKHIRVPYASANKESDRSFCYMLSMQFVTKGTEFSMYIIHISTKKDIERCKNIVYRTNTPLSTPFLREHSKLYIPSTLNTAYLLWHTVIVCAVEY